MSTVISKNVQIGADGTAANNFTWYQPSTPDGTVRLGSGNSGSVTDILSVTSTGLGIGTSSPARKLDVSGASPVRINTTANNQILLAVSGTAYGQIFSNSATAFGITDGGATGTILDLTQGGNLGLGVTPSAWTSGFRASQVGSAASVVGYLNRAYLSANWYYDGSANKYIASDYATRYGQVDGQHQWFTAPSGTAGNAISFTQAMTLSAAGDLMVGLTSVPSLVGGGYRQLVVGGSSGGVLDVGTTTTSYGRISGNVDGLNVEALGAYPTVFRTNSTERARIDSSGNWLVGKTSSSNTTVGVEVNQSAGSGNFQLAVGTASSSGSVSPITLYSTGAGAFRFYVSASGTIYATSTTITAISDQRLKENIQDLDVGLDKIMALKPRKFDWKPGKGKDKKGDRGWIAQEFEQVFPDMIDTWLDPAPEGEDPYKAVNADLIPVLVKALQEMKALVDTQAARIAALEAK